jgi:osmotically-inducible protein OsmY
MEESPRLGWQKQNVPYYGDTTKKYFVQEEAHMLFQHSPYRELWNIACEYQEGVLTLEGCVPSFFLKQVAQTIAQQVDRVETVNNCLEVVEYNAE